ncbi:MAG: ATP phosphoribosyltransferase regulatory subunit [Patescibacteria group bacterium]|nr:ATP phosphoribosyltransferase regulatory subunit [bacterium]MDZ4241090.1 ATP phosphoribosyltransferase regulatory subunit [Patescibacteria group bacterium]
MEEKAKKLSTESYKGVRDFYPEDMAVQNYIFSTWRKIVEEAGYQEYEASILEYADLYRSKGNDEIVNDQMYLFKDKGDREVALRPEMTPSLARMIAAKRRGLKLPLRWYSIPNVFRYERPQRGRKREHWQLNCDLIGVPGIEGDVEIISLAHKTMREFGAKDEDFIIRVNDRKLFDEIFEEIGGCSSSTRKEVIRLVDAQEKIDNFKDELTRNLGEEKKERFLELLNGKKTTKNLDNLKNELNSRGINNVVIDTNIARGFDYYTGIVFEAFDTNTENRRSLFGGGRYDNLLEMFGVEPVAIVGFGIGDVTVRDFLESHNLPLTISKKL